mgnify:CR=1 FL=1
METRRDNLIYALCDAIMSSSWSDILANCGFIRLTVFLSMFFIMRAWAFSCSGSASSRQAHGLTVTSRALESS